MRRADQTWNRVSRERPCPVCGKPDWCLVSADGAGAICARVETGSIKRCGDAGWLHWIDGASDYGGIPVPPPRVDVQTRDFAPLVANLSQNAGQAIRGLALQLGVSSQALERLNVGWNPSARWWSFPERDGERRITGVLTRDAEGNKRRLRHSRSGLCYADDWSEAPGPVLLVEGPTDTAAALTLGLSAIGRPSNRGGCAALVDLLQSLPVDRAIVVVGDNDPKPDGQWPGRDGAIATATQLALRLLRPVDWTLPPDRAKDVRAWLNRFPHAPPQSLAGVFLEGLDRQTITPPPVIRAVTPRGPTVALDDYRAGMSQARLNSLDRPGIYLDRSPTGSGKSQVDRQVISHMLQGGLAS